MRTKLRWLAATAAAIIVAGAIAGAATIATSTAAKAASPCGTTTTAPAYKHVIWIWFENHSYSDIIGSSRPRTSTRSPPPRSTSNHQLRAAELVTHQVTSSAPGNCDNVAAAAI
jgi:hypothetical protein